MPAKAGSQENFALPVVLPSLSSDKLRAATSAFVMTMNKTYTVLVADDSKHVRGILERVLVTLGHTPILAHDGQEAVELFAVHAPDLIILDVMMPGIDGYETARRIRKRAGTTWIPIIFLSAASRAEDELAGLEAGGDDFLLKPVNLPLLAAKIKVMQRIAGMQYALREKTDLLERYQEENEHETQLAQHIMNHLVRLDAFRKSELQYWMLPARHFSGDLLAAARTPHGSLYVVLADATGHGLSAALTGVPLIEMFYTMSGRGLPLSMLAHEMNRKIKALMPTRRFVAATLAAIHPQDRLIEVWNGCNPDAVFVGHDGTFLHAWPSTHPALGILDTEEFSGETEVFPWTAPGQLYLYSDGVIEAESPNGAAFSKEQLQHILATAAAHNRVERLQTAVTAHLDGRPAHDDISMLVVNCTTKDLSPKGKLGLL